MKRKICVVTGTRAEYGLLKPLLREIMKESTTQLQLVVTGMHLSEKFGFTFKEIEQDGFHIDRKIPILDDGDTTESIAAATSFAIVEITRSLMELKPDLIVLLGDRYEIFAAAASAMFCRIPIAHIHGGEATEGLIDEAIRHAVSKMSHLHFVSTSEYKTRLHQLGENPSKVFLVGSLGVENLRSIELKSREKLEYDLSIKLLKRNLLITFHPVTLEENSSRTQIRELLSVLSKLKETSLIFTYPNSDLGGYAIIEEIDQFVNCHPSSYAFASLGQTNYFSCMNEVDVVIGNSSSALIEAPSLKKAAINIGDRQRGRVKGSNVIDTLPLRNQIDLALKYALSENFKKILADAVNPYELPNTSANIMNVLKSVQLEGLLKKQFYDLEAR